MNACRLEARGVIRPIDLGYWTDIGLKPIEERFFVGSDVEELDVCDHITIKAINPDPENAAGLPAAVAAAQLEFKLLFSTAQLVEQEIYERHLAGTASAEQEALFKTWKEFNRPTTWEKNEVINTFKDLGAAQ